MLARAACKIDQFWVANCTAARRASSDADQDAASRIAARLAGSPLLRWGVWAPSSSRCCRLLGDLARVEQRTDQCASPAEALFGGIQLLVCKRRFNVSEQYREDDCERDEGSV